MFLQSKSLWQNTTGQLCFSKTLWRSSISSLSFALLGACFSNLKGKYNTHMWEFHSQKPRGGGGGGGGGVEKGVIFQETDQLVEDFI